MIEKAKFTFSLLRSALEKQKKTIGDQGRKQMDAIMNQSKKNCLINDGGHKLSHKKYLKKLKKKTKNKNKNKKKRFDEIIELRDETIFNDLVYYFKKDSNRVKFDDF